MMHLDLSGQGTLSRGQEKGHACWQKHRDWVAGAEYGIAKRKAETAKRRFRIAGQLAERMVELLQAEHPALPAPAVGLLALKKTHKVGQRKDFFAVAEGVSLRPRGKEGAVDRHTLRKCLLEHMPERHGFGMGQKTTREVFSCELNSICCAASQAGVQLGKEMGARSQRYNIEMEGSLPFHASLCLGVESMNL